MGDATRTDDELIDAILAHPILLNRPIVVTPLGTRLCRPPEVVLEILPRHAALNAAVRCAMIDRAAGVIGPSEPFDIES